MTVVYALQLQAFRSHAAHGGKLLCRVQSEMFLRRIGVFQWNRQRHDRILLRKIATGFDGSIPPGMRYKIRHHLVCDSQHVVPE